MKRYMSVCLLLASEVILSLFLPEVGAEAFTVSVNHFLEMLSFLPPVFVLLGLLDVWVDRESMIKLIGSGSGLRGAALCYLLGSAAAGPLYGAFPVAAVMLKKGASRFNVLIFLGAWSTTKLPLLTFEAASMGIRFTAVRLVLNLFGILLIASAADRLSR